MEIEGGCYCGAVRFKAEGDAVFKGQCHCRECQYIAGGAPNMVMGMPGTGFSYTKGKPKQFQRSDLDNPVTREFCADCGTHLVSLTSMVPGVALLKVGSLDDPAVFEGPQMAIFTCDKQSFHQVPEGCMEFDKTPG
jgi:hypothetical protein